MLKLSHRVYLKAYVYSLYPCPLFQVGMGNNKTDMSFFCKERELLVCLETKKSTGGIRSGTYHFKGGYEKNLLGKELFFINYNARAVPTLVKSKNKWYFHVSKKRKRPMFLSISRNKTL